jgi:hypothetical protein
MSHIAHVRLAERPRLSLSLRQTPRFLVLTGLLVTLTAVANDVPAPSQEVGRHSVLFTEWEQIRDDALVDYMCSEILSSGGQTRGVTLIVSSSYGGGFLDDMQRAFGASGACAGIPWVAAAAAGPEQTARRWGDQAAQQHPGELLGTTWIDGLAGDSSLNVRSRLGAIRNGSASNSVLQDLRAAGLNDAMGPNGQNRETPHVASGNGGHAMVWNRAGGKHQVVLYGGFQASQRNYPDIENMSAALDFLLTYSQYTWYTVTGGDWGALEVAIRDAAAALDENTQLIIFLSGHGGTMLDLGEAPGGITAPIEAQKTLNFEIHDGWLDGQFGNYFATREWIPPASLDLYIDECRGCSEWQYELNGHALDFPGVDRTGLVQLLIPFAAIQPGSNALVIGPGPAAQAGRLTLSHLELSSGPVDELQAEQILRPAQSAAYYDPDRNGEGLFVELHPNGRALVYLFSYTPDGARQAWMLGTGEQVGEGIIVHDLLLPAGGRFGAEFDADGVVNRDFGSLFFRLPTCGSSLERGKLFVYPEAATGFSHLQSQNYVQLNLQVDCETGAGPGNTRYAGSWYDPAHDGQGLILQVLTDDSALVQWLTYDNAGNQVWIQGRGAFTGSRLVIDDPFTAAGPAWGADFDPASLVLSTWGGMSLENVTCWEAQLNYDAPDFTSGTLNLVPLTAPMGITNRTGLD